MASPVQLPDDIVYCNILPRLPFRTLTRLTAVCKAWRLAIRGDDAFAALQAQTPSPASVAIARCHQGSLRILSPDSAGLVPRDRYLSFVEVHHGNLSFCACAGGVVCLMEHPFDTPRRRRWLDHGAPAPAEWRYVCNFFIVNPNRTTRRIRRVPYEGDALTAGLAYSPEAAPRDGFQLVVPVADDGGRCRFRRFTSRRPGWSASREAFALPPLEEFKPKPVYGSGRVHWLAGNVVVWYDLEGDHGGTTPLPADGDGDGDGRECNGNHHDLSVWRDQLRLARVNTHGVWVWELAGERGARARRWEVVHSRLWEGIPGSICPGTVVMEAGGEKAVYVVVVTEMERGDDDSTNRKTLSRRGLLRYDVRTGPALVTLDLRHYEKIGSLVDYHSSMAKLPDIMWHRRKNPQKGRKCFWGA